MKTFLKPITDSLISVDSSNLPPITIIPLNTWSLIRLNGVDSIQFLHNQFTCDIKNLDNCQYTWAAHCNAQGKMIANMYVFYFKKNEIAYIESKNILKKQISILQKYSIFSNTVIIPDDNTFIIGVAGLHARKYLNTFFTILPDTINTVIQHSDATIIYFKLPIERFLLIINNITLYTTLLNKSKISSVQFNDHNQWIALDIEAGYPYINMDTSELFFPQSVNMDILNGISFKKGCFMGQEIIARIQYRKLNKRSLYHLSVTLDRNKNNIELPKSGDNIEIYMSNKYWKKIGTVLQSCRIKNQIIWMQAVLNKSIASVYYPTLKKAKIGNSFFNLDFYITN